MRTKFKIMYPKDYHDPKKAGKPYHPPSGQMVVMNNGGVFFIWDSEDYCQSLRKLSSVLYSYDVVWK
jgi:hypothetical protein